jgi:hypothetical protein
MVILKRGLRIQHSNIWTLTALPMLAVLIMYMMYICMWHGK